MKLTKQQVGIALATTLTIVVGIAVNLIPLNGTTTLEVLNKFDFQFIPANYTFFLWGFIYALLIIFSFGQQTVAQKEREYTKDIFSWYILAAIVNSLWLVAWHFDFFLTSIILMLTLLTSLIAIYSILRNNSPKSIMERIIIHVPFQAYLGWVTFLFITNISIVIDSYWNNFGLNGTVASALLLLLIGTIGVLVILYLFDLLFVSVLIWSVIGIIVNNHTQTDLVIVAAITLILMISIALLKKYFKPKSKDKEEQPKKKKKVFFNKKTKEPKQKKSKKIVMFKKKLSNKKEENKK